MVLQHIESLAKLGPRPPGSKADAAARAYLADAFDAVGADVEIIRDDERHHLVATLSGHSKDGLLIAATYPSLDEDTWVGDSDMALLLELARVLARSGPHPYTVRLALAEATELEEPRTDKTETAVPAALGPGDALPIKPSRAIRPSGPRLAREQVVSAGESLARGLSDSGELTGLRAIFVIDGSGAAGLKVARDLRSHPVYREVAWSSARSLGFESIFPVDSGWASPASLHLGFKEHDLEGVLALVDESRARPELMPTPTTTPRSSESLEAVGRVTLDALGRVMHRLSRVDDFGSERDRGEARGQAGPQALEIPPSS